MINLSLQIALLRWRGPSLGAGSSRAGAQLLEFRSVPASGTLGVSFLSLSLVQFQDRWIELQLVVSGGTSYVYGWGGRKGMFKLDNTNGRGYSM